MSHDITKCSEFDFDLIKKIFYRNIYDSSVLKTSFFSKKAFIKILKIFHNDNDKLKKFLKTDNILSSLNEATHQKIDTLVLKIIEENPESFIKDKKFRIYALRYLNLKTIKYNENYLIINNQLYELKTSRFEFFSGANNLDMVNLFSDNYLKKLIVNVNESFVYEKDIFNNLISYIRNELGTIDDLSIEHLSKNKDDSKLYIEILNEIVDNKLYLRKRKNTDPKSLTKANAKEVFSNYLNNNHQQYFEDFCKDNNISIVSIRHDDFFKYIRHIYYYLNFHKSRYFFNSFYQLKDNFFGIKYYFDSAEELLNTFYSKYNFDISKRLNPKKYSFKTKNMIKENKNLISVYQNYNSIFFDKLLTMIDNLKIKEVSEKTIRTILKKIFNTIHNSQIIMKREIGFSIELEILQRYIHDVMVTIENYIKMSKTENVLMLRSYLHLCNAFNYTSFQEIYSLNTQLNEFILNEKILSQAEDRIFKNLTEFNKLLSEFEASELEKELILAKGKYSEESLNIAKNMKVFKNYLKLLNTVPDSFNENSNSEEVFIEDNMLKVEILSHKTPIGLLGAFVGGVCIDGAGKHRLDQINKNFMNLVIRDDKKINLWGLLCEGTYNDSKIFVLNNLQGSVNSDKEEILELIYKALLEFKKVNNIKTIFFKKLGFNSLNLNGKKAGLIELSLNKKIRLDFNEKDNFYFL